MSDNRREPTRSDPSPPDTPERNSWADILGPCYTSQSIARTLGWTESQVAAAAESLQLLELRTTDDVRLYPEFQLWNGGIVDGLPEVLRVLRAGINDSWTWAQWLNTRPSGSDGIDEPSSIEQLREGNLSDVLRDARHDAWSWSS